MFGIINTFGILFVKLRERQEAEGDPDAAFKCSLVGSLAIGSTFFISFLAGILVDRVRLFFVLIFLSKYFCHFIFQVGLRTTAMCGALLSTLGLALSAIYHDNISVLYLTYGIMFGAGASLIYTPSLAVLGEKNIVMMD